MEDFYDYLQRIMQNDGVAIPSRNCDLTLDIMPTVDGQTQWSYYYACHETRCLFWLDPFNATILISELFGVKSPAHVSALYMFILGLPSVFESVPINSITRASIRGTLLVRWLLCRLDSK